MKTLDTENDKIRERPVSFHQLGNLGIETSLSTREGIAYISILIY